MTMTTTNTPLAARQHAAASDTKGSGSDVAALARLRNHAQSLRLRRRQALPAAATESVYIIKSGLVASETTAVAGQRTMVELLYPGDIITPSLQPATAALTYITMAATELWRIPASVFKSEMASDGALGDFVFQRLNLQRARMQLHITMLAGLSSEQRVAGLLLKAAYHLGTINGSGISFDMPLSRTEVAEYLALNADTLSRIMSRLERENVLARSSRAQVTVRNLDALKAHCPLSDSVAALHSEASL